MMARLLESADTANGFSLSGIATSAGSLFSNSLKNFIGEAT